MNIVQYGTGMKKWLSGWEIYEDTHFYALICGNRYYYAISFVWSGESLQAVVAVLSYYIKVY